MSLSRCSKLIYFFFHTSLCIADVVIIGLASYILAMLLQYKIFLPILLYWPIIILIFTCILQFFGFWKGFLGILQENKFFVIIFCVSLILHSIINVLIGIWALSVRNDTNENINEIMDSLYKNYTKLQIKKEEWNYLQIQLKCCGIDGPQSYSQMGADFLPISCCNTTINSKFCDSGHFYKTGCVDSLTLFANEQIFHFIVLVFVFVGLQIVFIGIFCNLNAVLNEKLDIRPPTPENLPLRRKSLNI